MNTQYFYMHFIPICTGELLINNFWVFHIGALFFVSIYVRYMQYLLS